ncbi:MAG: RnfABCDGE type electron transport complex subunit D, partial [Oscillospiraceae bacterium]
MISETRYRKQALNICLALIPILAMSCFYYGPRVLILAVLSVSSAVVADYICLRFQGERNWKKNDFSSLITGLLFVVFLPASIPYWLVIFGSVFAMVVVR